MIARRVVCGLCSLEFPEDVGQPVCRACPLAGVCHNVRCPSCGYENALPPAWLARLAGRFIQ